MYKLIGGDQKEYGPVSFEQLAAWVRDNRANAQTLVQKEGGPWVQLGSLPEFAALLGGPPPAPASASAESSAFPSAGPTAGPGGAGGGYVPRGVDPMGMGPGQQASAAKDAVQGPAIGLLITGILGVVATTILIGFALLGAGANMLTLPPDMPPEARQAVEMAFQSLRNPSMLIARSLMELAFAGLLIFASIKMRRLESFPLAVAGAILAIVPCTSPCCCVGIPVGIWVLVTILKPGVKSAFR